MKTYDSILVLGSQPDYTTWRFPSHTYDSLDRAVELINQGAAPYLALSGDHALKYDHTGITQPFRECDAEEEYVLSKGLAPSKILKEGESRDTIAQFYYLKNLVFRPHNIHNVLMVTVDFRVERLKFMWQKVMGPNYLLAIETVPYEDKDVYTSEAKTLKRQQEWLKDVADGDDMWFKDKFYSDPYYLRVKMENEARMQTEIDPRKLYLI